MSWEAEKVAYCNSLSFIHEAFDEATYPTLFQNNSSTPGKLLMKLFSKKNLKKQLIQHFSSCRNERELQ